MGCQRGVAAGVTHATLGRGDGRTLCESLGVSPTTSAAADCTQGSR